MGGQVWVTSDYGHGSSFHFSCIVKYATEDISVISSQLYPFRKHKVLFVDKGATDFNSQLPKMTEELGLLITLATDEKNIPKPARVESGNPSKRGKIGDNGYDVIIVDDLALSLIHI